MTGFHDIDAQLAALRETVARILSDNRADADGRGRFWQVFADVGLPRLAVPEPIGSADLAAAVIVAETCGAYALGLLYPDAALVGAPVAAGLGFQVTDEPTLIVAAKGEARAVGETLHIELTARAVPWARCAAQLVLLARATGVGDVAIRTDPRHLDIGPGSNLAGEPRDAVRARLTVREPDWVAVGGDLPEEVLRRGALARAACISGAMGAVLERSVAYAGEWTQFGRAIGSFQIVQHSLAEIAIETAATNSAVAAATRACVEHGFNSDPAGFAVSVAKAQASTAAGLVSRAAHQIHGAIGTAREYPLHVFTTRLWAWRDEYGSEHKWQARIGREAITSDIWQLIAN